MVKIINDKYYTPKDLAKRLIDTTIKVLVYNGVNDIEDIIEPSAILQRHLFWSNKPIANKKFEKDAIRTKNKISDFDNYEVVVNSKISNKRQVLRNCVKPEIGLYILSEILK